MIVMIHHLESRSVEKNWCSHILWNSEERAKSHLPAYSEELRRKIPYNLSYGTTVQLCVARNKRRISAKRYRGATKVTCRRARIGFTVKLNPDSHYCTAMYRNLDYIQFQNGEYKLVLNRDDQAGFRFDTTYTHWGHTN